MFHQSGRKRYCWKWAERSIYGHVIFAGKPNFKGKYLRDIRSTNESTFQFQLLPNLVYLEPDKIYQSFVEIEKNLTITKELNPMNIMLYTHIATLSAVGQTPFCWVNRFLKECCLGETSNFPLPGGDDWTWGEFCRSKNV